MTETADVVIIGSGIVGSSVAYHLAEQGCTNVLVIEREAHQGKGSTGKSMGGVRAQFATPVNIQMSRYSIDFFSSSMKWLVIRRIIARMVICSARPTNGISII